MLCIKRETTERVQSEKFSRDEAKRLKAALFAGNPLVPWDWDAAAKDLLTCDEPFALIYRLDPERATKGLRYQKLWPAPLSTRGGTGYETRPTISVPEPGGARRVA